MLRSFLPRQTLLAQLTFFKLVVHCVQAISLLSELKQTQRSVVKCLSEAEQAKKDYDELKHKTEMIMLQLQRVSRTFMTKM